MAGQSEILRRVSRYPVVREDELVRVLGRFSSAEEISDVRARLNPYLVAPREVRQYVHVSVQDYWNDVKLGDGWAAAFRFRPQGGQPVISEIRIYPDEEDGMGPGRWSAELLGSLAPVPAGGLSARLVHKVRLGAALRAARTWLARLPRAPHSFGRGAEYEPFAVTEARAALTRVRPGRKGHGLAFFAELAKAYSDALDKGNPHPGVTLARDRGLTRARVRDMIHRARKLGLLTPAPRQGQRGGSLTPKARAILNVAHGKNRMAATRRTRGRRR